MSLDALPCRVRAFVYASAVPPGALDRGAVVKSWFVSLEREGVLIELGRAHLRTLIEPRTLTHAEYAAWLGLATKDGAKAYRALCLRPEQDREELISLTRRVLRVVEPERFPSLQRCPEHLRLQRAFTVGARRRTHVGRPITTIPTYGRFGKELERRRVDAELAVDDWAKKLGLGTVTYRRYIEREDSDRKVRVILAELVPHAADAVEALRGGQVGVAAVVSVDELDRAYDVVAADLERLRERFLAPTDATVELPPASTPRDAQTSSDGFLKLDLYSWLKPEEENP